MSPEPHPLDPGAVDPDTRARVVDPAGEALQRLALVMARLRAPDGCPWDREQTHTSLARHLVEETYEVLEAIDSGDAQALREELGDVLLQVVFHAQLAYEEQAFVIADVVDGLVDKLIRRHPHVFGDAKLRGADEVLANWERQKRAESDASPMAVPSAMPALARAAKLSSRAAQLGLGPSSPEAAAATVDSELDGLRELLASTEPDTGRVALRLGDALFALATLGHRLGVEPEGALRHATQRFAGRFRAVESRAAAAGRDLESLSADEWAEYWEEATPAPRDRTQRHDDEDDE